MKRYQILVLGLLLGTAAIAGSVGGARLATRSDSPLGRIDTLESRPKHLASPMDDLDYHVQERMRTSEGFGMSRVFGLVHIMNIVSLTNKASDEERAVIAELERQGLRVGVYLGSRGLLEAPVSEAVWNEGEKRRAESKRKPIGEPVLISGEVEPEGMPGPFELWEIGQKALVISKTSDRYESSIGRWKVDARPVRAAQESCLKCHSSEHPDTKLKIGDALGVVMYVYARDTK